MEFTHDKLPELFEEIRYSSEASDIITQTYYLHQNGSDVLSIHWLGDNEWRFVKDNFPFERKFYSTNFPIKTVERFISEMKHIGFTIKEKNKNI